MQQAKGFQRASLKGSLQYKRNMAAVAAAEYPLQLNNFGVAEFTVSSTTCQWDQVSAINDTINFHSTVNLGELSYGNSDTVPFYTSVESTPVGDATVSVVQSGSPPNAVFKTLVSSDTVSVVPVDGDPNTLQLVSNLNSAIATPVLSTTQADITPNTAVINTSANNYAQFYQRGTIANISLSLLTKTNWIGLDPVTFATLPVAITSDTDIILCSNPLASISSSANQGSFKLYIPAGTDVTSLNAQLLLKQGAAAPSSAAQYLVIESCFSTVAS